MAALLSTPAPAPAQPEGTTSQDPSTETSPPESFPLLPQQSPALHSSDDKVRINSLETVYNQETGVATAEGNVDIKFGDLQIYAGRAEYHRSSGDIFARDNVRIHKGEFYYAGNDVVYNVKTGEVIATDLRSAVGPVFYEAKDLSFNAETTEIIRLENASLTTHDNEQPNYHVKAKRIEIYPDDRVVFHDAKIYAGDIPVMWLPYLSQSFDDELGYSFSPGYGSRWGAFLLNQYGFLIRDHSLVRLHLDARSARGFAGGFDVESLRYKENKNYGQLSFYYAHDSDPTATYSVQNRTGLSRGRYRFSLQHRIYLPGPEESTLYVDVDINKFSDEFFLEDFFPSEFIVNPRPDNIVNIVKQDPRFEISLWGRFRVNEFFATDSRLPELAVDFTRQPIFNTGFFYEGQTSIGRYEEEIADARKNLLNNTAIALLPGLPGTQSAIDALLVAASGNQFTRFNTYHQVLYPYLVTDGFSLVPRVGIGATSYFDVGGGSNNTNETRFLFHAGLDAALKFSKLYPDAQLPRLGVNKLRHIFQPYVNYSYIAADELPGGYPLIDRFAPTTQLRPLDIPLFPAVDELRDWNVIRLGSRNTLQTLRNVEPLSIADSSGGSTHNWLELDTFFEYYVTDGELSRTYSNLFNELRWWPLPWLLFRLDSQLPVFGDDFDFTEINSSLTFMPFRSSEIRLGLRFLENSPFIADSNLLYINTYTRLNDNWGFGMDHRIDTDNGIWQYQQYSVYRDLSSWTVGLGALVLDNDVTKEYGFALTLSLKDFPAASIPFKLSVFPDSEDIYDSENIFGATGF